MRADRWIGCAAAIGLLAGCATYTPPTDGPRATVVAMHERISHGALFYLLLPVTAVLAPEAVLPDTAFHDPDGSGAWCRPSVDLVPRDQATYELKLSRDPLRCELVVLDRSSNEELARSDATLWSR